MKEKSERETRWQQRGYKAMEWRNSEEGRPCPLVKLSASTSLPDKCGCCVVANGQGNVSEERRGQSDLSRPPLSGASEGRLCPAQLWWPFLRRIFSHEQGTVLPAQHRKAGLLLILWPFIIPVTLKFLLGIQVGCPM